ncbi:MAG TPA: hypothetical protein VHS32_16645, partial [Streptosporangiaceae bacterium]|nr:hypothetical protein [Streptosporangiaceae bacterium]
CPPHSQPGRCTLGRWVTNAPRPTSVRAAGEPLTLDDGMQAFWLRLTPPLATLTDAVEVVVTGPAARVRATVPVRSR